MVIAVATYCIIFIGISNIKHQSLGLKPPSVVSVTFLVAVNETEIGCLTTSKLLPLRPAVLHNKTDYVYVGNCDYGALDFNISTSSEAL